MKRVCPLVILTDECLENETPLPELPIVWGSVWYNQYVYSTAFDELIRDYYFEN
jgi:hypothetical protein